MAAVAPGDAADVTRPTERMARELTRTSYLRLVDRERQRFVADLHDDALQKLTAAELFLERVASNGNLEPASLEGVRKLLEQTETAIRRLIFDIRPPDLEGPGGLERSVRERLAMLAELGIQSELEFDLVSEPVDEVSSTVFRQISEAIGNVERHSGATTVRTSLTLVDGGVLGVVQDNGQGFVVAERSNLPGHLGLLTLRERALMAGGRYKIESRPGAGTRIEFWIPLED